MIARAFNRLGFLICTTPIEVAIGAGVGAVIAGAVAFSDEYAKRGQIPLAFSEIGQTILYREKIDNKTIPPLTMYYASLNDALMQVFEASNIAHNNWGGDWARNFAFELEKKIEPTFRIHRQFPEYAKTIPAHASASLKVLERLAQANRQLPPMVSALSGTWDERHTDVTKTEVYYERVCNAQGKECKDVRRTREVYDYTIHRYDYDRSAGLLSTRLMTAFSSEFPNLAVDEKLFPTWATNAENEEAIRNSRRQLPGYKAPTKEEYLRLANIWATGSNYGTLMPQIAQTQSQLHQRAAAWSQAEPRASSQRYITHSNSDSGPREYRIANAAHETAARQAELVGRLISGIEMAQTRIQPLAEKMQLFVNAALHNGPGNPNRLGSEVLEEARELYQRNYAGGFDPYPSAWGYAMLLTLLGAGAGAGLGWGADAWGNRRRGFRPRLSA